jgi:hypothetical protein
MHFALALAIAINFWGARSVHVPCHPIPVPGADAQLAKDAWGWPMAMSATSGCRVLISSVAQAQRHSAPEWYCAFTVHEVGHLAGLPHTERGIMAADGPDSTEIPWDCYHWRTFARRHHIPIRR